MRGPATAKLLIPSVVVVLGTNNVPVSADRRCRLPAIAEIGHIARDNHADNVPAHQMLLTGVDLLLGRLPSADWRRP